jgi:hypothetical protein
VGRGEFDFWEGEYGGGEGKGKRNGTRNGARKSECL